MSDPKDPEKDKKNDSVPSNTPVREYMVNTAVNFLQNPKVQSGPLSQKRAFLLKKGLTEEEIDLAFQRAGNAVTSAYPQQQLNSIVPVNYALQPEYQPSFWSYVHKYSSTVIIVGIALYGLHRFYKLYIEPWLFGNQRKDDRMAQFERQLLELNRSLSQLRRSVSSIEESLNAQKEQLHKSISEKNREIQDAISPSFFIELKADVATVKSLLLSRHQFPDVPKINPTIPEWQLVNGASGKYSEPDDDAVLVDKETECEPNADEQNKTTTEKVELEKEEILESSKVEKLQVEESSEQAVAQEEQASLSASSDSFEHCSSTA